MESPTNSWRGFQEGTTLKMKAISSIECVPFSFLERDESHHVKSDHHKIVTTNMVGRTLGYTIPKRSSTLR